MKIKFILATLVAATSAFNPGGTLSVDFNTLGEAKTTYFDYVLNGINKIEIPDISFGSGSITGN